MATALEAFLGLWVDPRGRVLFVGPAKRDGRNESQLEAEVTLTDGVTGTAFQAKGLGLRKRPTRDLPATVADGELRVEVGDVGLGPTLHLQLGPDGLLVPRVQMGLYDDWEEDLGVPWAFPLETYRRATPDEREHWSAAHAAMRK